MKVLTDETSRVQVIDSIVELVHVIRTMQAGSHPWLDLDLTMAQLKALIIVVETGGLPSRGLADRLSISAPAVTPLVDRLIEQRLVRREDDPADRRVVLIKPTARAVSLQHKLLEMNRSSVARVVDELSEDEIADIEQALTHLLRAAGQAIGHAPKRQPR